MGSNETYGPSVCTYHFQLIYLASFNINSFQSQTCTEDLGQELGLPRKYYDSMGNDKEIRYENI